MSTEANGRPPPGIEVAHEVFDDIDAMAAGARQWEQQYDQIGRGPFWGRLTQVDIGGVQLGRESWSPGVLQTGTAPRQTWAFGLPLRADGSLHVRRRPVHSGQLLVGTCADDIAFAATGRTDLMVVVLRTERIERWLQARRSSGKPDPASLDRQCVIAPADMARRARHLARLLDELVGAARCEVTPAQLAQARERLLDVVLGILPSAERVESPPARARIARMVMELLRAHRDSPPSMTTLCEQTGARERTLHLSCVEAFGRPPGQLLLDLRLSAARRALSRPGQDESVTRVAARFGFTHFGRFSSMYARQFGELPSATLAIAAGGR